MTSSAIVAVVPIRGETTGDREDDERPPSTAPSQSHFGELTTRVGDVRPRTASHHHQQPRAPGRAERSDAQASASTVPIPLAESSHHASLDRAARPAKSASVAASAVPCRSPGGRYTLVALASPVKGAE